MGDPLPPVWEYIGGGGDLAKIPTVFPFHFESVPYGILFNLFQYPLPSHHLIKLNQICAISIYINPTKLHPTCY